MLEWGLYRNLLLAVVQDEENSQQVRTAITENIVDIARSYRIGRIEGGSDVFYDSDDYSYDYTVIQEYETETGGKQLFVACPNRSVVWNEQERQDVGIILSLIRHAMKNADAVSRSQEDGGEDADGHSNVAAQLEEAIAAGEYLAYYQPKVDIRNNSIIGAEALVRRIKDGKIISPGAFIPILEKTGEICRLDMFIFEQVCKDIRSWLDKGLTVSTISSNFSMLHLQNEHLVDDLREIADRHGIDYGHLEIEMTETMNAEAEHKLLSLIQRLRDVGFRTALDDFGSGYSSLSLVKEIPVDVIKLDKSLLSRQHDFTTLRNNDRALMRHMVGLTKDMQMMSLAEGVETAEQRDFLRSIGCNYVQGFLFDRPLPPEQFEERLRLGSYPEGHNANKQAQGAGKAETKKIQLKGKVLLAEDNEINREITVGILEAMGVEVDTANDGSEAYLRFMNSEVGEYHIILMDIQMPVMDGYQSSEAIRNLPREDAKTVPIIAITVDTYKETRDLAEAAGMSGYVTKPLDTARLLKVFEEWGGVMQ